MHKIWLIKDHSLISHQLLLGHELAS